jgi:uncharacterized protein YdaL
MDFKKRRRLWTGGATALVALLGGARTARAEAPGRALVLYYPQRPSISREVGAARMVGNLLGHFDLSADVRCATDYHPGDGANYRAVFYVQLEPGLSPPAALVSDVPRLKRPVCWLGGGLSSLHPEKLGVTAGPYAGHSPFDHVRYRGAFLTRSEPELFSVRISDPARAQVLATAVSGAREQPYAVRSGSFWYFGDTGVLNAAEDDRVLAFADLLHDVLGVRHAPSRTALVRIEDVSVDSDPQRLRQIADLFAARRVPFLVALIPVYRNPAKNVSLPMSAKPEFVEAIRYMMSRGGSIVMHGGSHQYHGISADDAEFFDMEAQKPIPEDSDAYVESKVGLGLRELLQDGVPPLAWETPHYLASQRDYRVLARIFDTSVEQKLVCDSFDYEQYFPYALRRDRFGQQVIPENLGFVPRDDLNHAEDLLRYAKAHTVVRDSSIGFFFHPFLDLSRLARLVDGVRGEGYTFLDLKQTPHRVQFRNMAVQSGRGTVSVSLRGELLHEYYLDPAGQRQRESWSREWLTGTVTRPVDGPPGWIYVAEGRQTRAPAVAARPVEPGTPQSWWSRFVRWAGFSHAAPEQSSTPQLVRGAILWDAQASGPALPDQRSYLSAFQALGIKLEPLSAGELPARLRRGGFNLVVAPGAATSRLSAGERDALLAFARGGGNLVTEGRSGLSEALGLRFGTVGAATRVVEELDHLDRVISWQRPTGSAELMPTDDATVFTRDRKSHHPLVVGGQFGRGHYLALALPFDEQSELGVARFPYLTHDALRHFNLRPALRANRLHAYFDPDLRWGKDPEYLAAAWQAAGISAIHVKAWRGNRKGRPYNYDLLIESCHRRGIAVYAWLELPMADAEFYFQHPEWREVAADGKPAYGRTPTAWRYLMAMEDPACEQALLGWTRGLLHRHAWDGVDLAELYFESELTFDPNSLTPMHPTARRRFQALAGFDPKELVNPESPRFWKKNTAAWKRFEDWRVDEVSRLHADALDAIAGMRSADDRPLDVIVTVHDSHALPTIRRDTGIDTRRIVALLRRHDFSLQIEDPSVLWSTDPRRYVEIGNRYRKMLTPAQAERLMLDINVMDLPVQRKAGKTLFPTIRQTGVELDQLLAAAGSVVRRVTLYAENSVPADDWAYAASALGAADGSARTVDGGWQVRLERGALVAVDRRGASLTLDGADWPVDGDGEVLIPAGTHTVALGDTGRFNWEPPIYLDDATVELLGTHSQPDGLRLEYRAPGPGSVMMDGTVYRVTLEDGRRLPFQRVGEQVVVMCPAGRHALQILAEPPAFFRLHAASFYSSSLLSLFASGAITLLLGMYGAVRRRRDL